jgi:Peptidase family M28
MKNNTILSLAFFLFSIGVSAQKDWSQEYAKRISESRLKEHLYFLASDDMEGRETGMEGQRKAAAFLDQYYSSIGITTQRQIFPLKKLYFTDSKTVINGETFLFIKDFYFFSARKTEEIKSSEVVFVGYGIHTQEWNDYQDLDVKNKIVVCLSAEPIKNGKSLITGTEEFSDWTFDREIKRKEAIQQGAKMFIQIDQNYDQYMSRIKYYLETPRMTLDRTGSEDDEDLTIPYLHCSERFAEVLLKNAGYKNLETMRKIALKGKKAKAKKSKLDLNIDIHVKREDLVSDNVLAFLEGEDPELRAEVVVISAHYDHVGIINGQIHNGADDDGSGTVSVMEIAKAFTDAKKEGHGPKRSILFLHVSGEEKGLLGSEWYSDHPIYPLVNTVCDLNIDMVGRKDADHQDDRYVYLIGSDKLSTDLHKISENCNQKYTQLQLDYTYNDPNDPNQFYYRSDHYNFAKHNIPVIFYFSGVHEDYHKPGDDPEKILYSKMTEIDQLVFHTAWEIANRAEKLKVDVINDFNNK